MKDLKIGEVKYRLITNIGEIKYSRMNVFNQYIAAVFQGMDIPLFAVTMDKIKAYYNKGEYMQAYNEMINFDTAIKMKDYHLDPLGMCFSLICLEDGEDATLTDEAFLKEKLQRMITEGLDYDVVKKEVVNFMKLYPDKFSPYLQAWEMMKMGVEL
jgi:hypothetical protein